MNTTVKLFAIIICLLTLRISSLTEVGDSYDSKSIFYYENITKNSTCSSDNNESVLCLRKCCEENYVLLNETCVRDNSSYLNISSISLECTVPNDTEFQFVIGMVNCKFYKLDPEHNFYEDYYVDVNGKLLLPGLEMKKNYYEYSQFCFEYSVSDEQVVGYVCVNDDLISENVKTIVRYVGMIISMPLLLATFFVYASLPEINFHGKCLMCYTITVFGADGFFMYFYASTTVTSTIYSVNFHIGYYLFMVSYFWMNVMAIDIWRTFSGLRGFSKRKSSEWKKFLFYSVYAWGGSLLSVLLLILGPLVLGTCWMTSKYRFFIFYGPTIILFIANIILYTITGLKIKQIQRDISILKEDESKKHEKEKQQFNLYINLMLVMGITWSTELIIWLLHRQFEQIPIEIIDLMELSNTFSGVYIFIIFVCKKNIFKSLKQRCDSTTVQPR